MFKIKITAIRKVEHKDLSLIYENPIKHACDIKEGEVFIVEDAKRTSNFCESAWESVYPFVYRLANGEENFFDHWMKNKKSAMISCNDGFRPVSFYIEVIG